MHSLLCFIKTSKIQILILSCFWLLMQLLIFNIYGMRTGDDTLFYCQIAEKLSNSTFPQGREWFYFAYPFQLFLIHYCGLAYTSIVWVQLCFSFLGMICLYKLGTQLFQNNSSGFLAALLYIFWFKIHQWTFFLYTESMYTSFTIITFYLLLKDDKLLWVYIVLFLSLLIVVFLRPNSIAIVMAVLVYFWFLYKDKLVNKLYLNLVLGLLILTSLFVVNRMLFYYDLTKSYAKAEVIYPNFQFWVSPPRIISTKQTFYPILDVLIFAVHNPIFFLKLFVIKVLLFYSNAKPYFSTTHNITVVLCLTLIYLSFTYVVKRTISRKSTIAILVLVLLQGLIVGLTTENWDGRFLIPILPLIFVLASGLICYFPFFNFIRGDNSNR